MTATAPAAVAKAELIVGLDLGQSQDPSALAVLKRTPLLDAEGEPDRDARGRQRHQLDVIGLKRWPLMTPYPEIVSEVKAICGRPDLHEVYSHPRVAIDATGVGRAVVDLFVAAVLPVRPVPITITGGQTERQEPWGPGAPVGWWIPKLSLVGAIQAGLGTGRLKIVPTLPLSETLMKELLSFRVKVTTSANEQFGTWRENDHDDLVLAVAIAAWLADHPPRVMRVWID